MNYTEQLDHGASCYELMCAIWDTKVSEKEALQLLVNIVENIFDRDPDQLDEKELEDYLLICSSLKVGNRVHEIRKYLDEI